MSALSPASPEAVADLIRTLDPAHQTSLFQFAQFLKAQEGQAALDQVDEADEEEWDRLFEDPVRVAAFARWADESLARETPQPIDRDRL